MKIKLNEFNNLGHYMKCKGSEFEEFMCDVEEQDDYTDVLSNITMDSQHIISEYLREAIQCGFSEEIMLNDYCIPEEFIELLLQYKDKELTIWG